MSIVKQNSRKRKPPSENNHAGEFFPTPEGLVRAALALWYGQYHHEAPHMIIDAGAGMGAWGRAARHCWPSTCIIGVDLTFETKPPEYDLWRCHDYIGPMAIYNGADLVIGNPPFSLAEPFVVQAMDDLAPGGHCLLRLAFLEGQARGKDFWPFFPPLAVHVLSRRPSFTGDGISDPKTAYAIFIWRKDYQGETRLGWLDWGGQ